MIKKLLDGINELSESIIVKNKQISELVSENKTNAEILSFVTYCHVSLNDIDTNSIIKNTETKKSIVFMFMSLRNDQSENPNFILVSDTIEDVIAMFDKKLGNYNPRNN